MLAGQHAAAETARRGRRLAGFAERSGRELRQQSSRVRVNPVQPVAAGEAWLKANPDQVDTWLAGVTTIDGQPGAAAVKQSLGL